MALFKQEENKLFGYSVWTYSHIIGYNRRLFPKWYFLFTEVEFSIGVF